MNSHAAWQWRRTGSITGPVTDAGTTILSGCLAATNADPQPFTWTKDPSKIIAAVKRGHQLLDSTH